MLPPELRLTIWRLIANTPRTISISCTHLSSPEQYIITNDVWRRNPDYHITGVKHNARTVPAILSVSQEARIMALEHYDFFFSPGFFGQLGFYINYDVDTLLISEKGVIDFFFAGLDMNDASSLPDEIFELEKKLKFLAFRGYYSAESLNDFGWVISRLKGLKELIIEELVQKIWNIDPNITRVHLECVKQRLDAAWLGKRVPSGGRIPIDSSVTKVDEPIGGNGPELRALTNDEMHEMHLSEEVSPLAEHYT
jgi:hypothetical protein